MYKSKYKIIFIVSLLLSFILSFLPKLFEISQQYIEYFYLGSIGSFFSVVVFCSFIWSFKDFNSKEKNHQIIVITIIYACVWEFIGWVGIYGTFDIKDMIAGVIGGIITFFIKDIVENRFMKKKMYKGS